MRTIKFRGKDLTTGKWAYGSLLQLNDQSQIVNYEGSPLVDPKTIGQFTGFKDINGVEIYEGDILESICFEDEDFHRIVPCEVKWDHDGWICDTGLDSNLLYTTVTFDPTVVGNIYDDPIYSFRNENI